MAGLPAALRKKRETLQAQATPEQKEAILGKPNLELVQGMVKQDNVIPMPEPKIENQPTTDSQEYNLDESQFYAPGSTVSEEMRTELPHTQEETVDWKSEAEKYRQEAEKNKTRWESLQGMYRSLEDKHLAINDDIARMKAESQELRARLEHKPAPQISTDDIDLNEQEFNTYKDAIPTIEKLAKKIAKQMYEPRFSQVDQEIKQLRETHSGVSKNLATTQAQTFLQAVKSHVNRGNPERFNEITNGQLKNKWMEYGGRRVPGTKATIGQFLNMAHEALDFDSVTEIFDNFLKEVESEPSNAPVKTSINKMMAPKLGSTGAVPIKEKPKLSFSKYKEANLAFRKGKMPPEEYKRIEEMYNKAKAENRIDYDA